MWSVTGHVRTLAENRPVRVSVEIGATSDRHRRASLLGFTCGILTRTYTWPWQDVQS
ncbi:hypothetical protein GGP56_003392 [Salinibacter ruber]|nr:hypothetical protein [Salinibacter ruber]